MFLVLYRARCNYFCDSRTRAITLFFALLKCPGMMIGKLDDDGRGTESAVIFFLFFIMSCIWFDSRGVYALLL